MRPLLVLSVLAVSAWAADKGLPPGVKDNKQHKKQPPSPEKAVKLFKPDKGFHVTLFAGEPDVCQPIGMAFDDRGRLWVAECFSYPKWTDKPAEGKDRILVFEDTDGDGKFDKRTVFWDRAYNLTSVAIGHGGVWALCASHLLFIPDKDGDDKPDGKPEVKLDGWTLKAGHNIVNGLTWGPDGWLYGCHGITAESRPGLPGTAEEKRARMNCGIWRYHPTRKAFEVVCHGTTNPWGLDFDEHGEGFFTNCVIGHLWHMVPGARYKRMYGQDYNKYAYELIDSTSEHLHWAGGNWTESRDGKGAHSDAGGGHAHSGCMVYLGDNFPREFRNKVFMGNIHGRRLNVDSIKRKGNSYVGERAPDFLKSDNEWYRAVAVTYGPDGGVYIADWCDLGECHDNDGSHRSSGRIYKVTHGRPKAVKGLKLRAEADEQLIVRAIHGPEWFSRRARLILAERAATNKLSEFGRGTIWRIGKDLPEGVVRELRLWWLMHSTGMLEEADIRGSLLRKTSVVGEYQQSWAIRLIFREALKPSERVMSYLENQAAHGESALVRLSIASALQRMSYQDRLRVGGSLARRAEDADDRVQPLLIWYGIEPAVAESPEEGLKLAASCKMPKLRQFIARRLAELNKAEVLAKVIASLAKTGDATHQRDMLRGLRDGLKGQRSVKMPAGWRDAYTGLMKSTPEVRRHTTALALQFDDAEVMTSLKKTLADTAADAGERGQALQALVEKGVPDLVPQLYKLLDEKGLRGQALRALAAYQDDDTPKRIVAVYAKLSAAEKQDAIATLASRPAYALALLDAIDQKEIARSDVTAFTARQLLSLKDNTIKDRLEKSWGTLRQSSADKKALIEKYKKQLTDDVLAKADPSRGRAVFARTCAQCHRLYGEGHSIGPDLTGSDRANLHYVLENSVDPGAVVGGDYRLTNVTTTKGRLISGIVVEESDKALTLQTATDKFVVPKDEIEDRVVANVSMMPEGQLEQMTAEELRDLVGYLRTKRQVPLPK